VNRDPTRSSPLSLSLSVARGLYHNPPSAANRLTHHEDLPRRGEYRSTVVGGRRAPPPPPPTTVDRFTSPL
jgi:hypothetical protein